MLNRALIIAVLTVRAGIALAAPAGSDLVTDDAHLQGTERTMRVVARFAASQVNRLHIGQKAVVTLFAYPGRSWSVHIVRLLKPPGQVMLAFDQPLNVRWTPGLSATVSVRKRWQPAGKLDGSKRQLKPGSRTGP